MENLKNLLGESYNENITLDEINTFLEGKKLVDLNGGGYVSKDKYQKQLEKYNEAVSKYADYDTIKAKYDEYVSQEKQSKLTQFAKNAEIKDEFIEFALMKIGDVEDVEKALKDFAKEHPQFTNKIVKVNSNPNLDGKGAVPNKNEEMNNILRRAAGRL